VWERRRGGGGEEEDEGVRGFTPVKRGGETANKRERRAGGG